MKKIPMTPSCKRCGKRYAMEMVARCHFPVMVGFEMESGETINICYSCLDALGRCKTEEEKERFFREAGV